MTAPERFDRAFTDARTLHAFFTARMPRRGPLADPHDMDAGAALDRLLATLLGHADRLTRLLLTMVEDEEWRPANTLLHTLLDVVAATAWIHAELAAGRSASATLQPLLERAAVTRGDTLPALLAAVPRERAVAILNGWIPGMAWQDRALAEAEQWADDLPEEQHRFHRHMGVSVLVHLLTILPVLADDIGDRLPDGRGRRRDLSQTA